MKKVLIADDKIDLRTTVETITADFDHTGELIYDKRNQVRLVNSEKGCLVVKRYQKPRLIDAIAYFFGKRNKAIKAFIIGNRIIELGFATPKPIAAVTIKKSGFQTQSFFISEYTPALSAKDILETPNFNRELARRLGKFIARLHKKGILHGDLNGSNVLIDGNSFSLIDTNRTRFIKPGIKQAAANIMRMTTRHDLLRDVAAGYAEASGIDENGFIREAIRAQYRFRKNKTIRHNIARKLHLRK